MEDFYPHTKKSTNFALRIFGLKYRMKNMIIKGISLRQNDWEKTTVQNRFQIFKAAGTTAQPPIVVPENGAAKSWFYCPIVEMQLFLSTCIYFFMQIWRQYPVSLSSFK